ncbi:MAG: beta-ketoacyl-[acyl-carrier-protein] synthase family protein [Paludibacter sp.]|nr:beta-ketoacyl-[acyl-carrier-protein] synthase family protein [Paludibacter sp.]
MMEIVIKGMGIVSAIGNNIAENLLALRNNNSGIALLHYLKTEHKEFPVGEVKLTNEQMISLLQIPENQPTTRTSLMGMIAVKEALQTAGIMPEKFSKRIAFINGTTVGGMDKSELFYADFLQNNTKNEYIATHDCGACTEMIADFFGFFSQVSTISTACSSAANAIILGAELLKNQRADVVVAGGAECLTKFHLNGFNTLMILDKNHCCPFDAARSGLNLGEGAAYIVMERMGKSNSLEKGRGEILLSGYANTCDAYHQTATSPQGEGAFLAMTAALKNANLRPEDIDYINAHGTGTPNNDLTEGIAIERVFGNKIPPISSTKAFTGHTTSAAGAVEAVISILSLQNNFIPNNLNFTEKMEELSFAPYIDNAHALSKQFSINHVLSNSFGFGGNDTCLIFSKK